MIPLIVGSIVCFVIIYLLFGLYALLSVMGIESRLLKVIIITAFIPGSYLVGRYILGVFSL